MAHDPVELIEGIASTRAIRRYRDEPVPTDALATMMFAATRAPSGSNRQPFRFLVLRDGPKALEAKRLIGESARSIWGGKRTADGYDRGSGHGSEHAEGAHGPHDAALRRPLRGRAGARAPVPRALPPTDAHRGRVDLPRVPEPAARGARARVRRGDDRLPRVRRGGAARPARDPRRGVHGRDHHDRQAGRRSRARPAAADLRARLRGDLGPLARVGRRPAGRATHRGRPAQESADTRQSRSHGSHQPREGRHAGARARRRVPARGVRDTGGLAARRRNPPSFAPDRSRHSDPVARSRWKR